MFKYIIIFCFALCIASCQSHEISTVEDLYLFSKDHEAFNAKHYSFWVFFPGSSVNRDAIRNDLVKTFNAALKKQGNNSFDKWTWREGNDFHIVNPASFYVVDPKEMVNKFESQIALYARSELEDFLLRLPLSYFDTINIHYYEDSTGLGEKRVDNVTRLETNRRKVLLNFNSPILTKEANREDF